MPTRDHGLLAQVRRSLRALNGAIEAGSKAAGLTVQQQGFLLSLAARGGRDVPLAELRADLSMDQATASELLARLARRGLVRRKTDSDRRALRVSLTSGGRLRFRRSVRSIRREIRAADARGELRAMRQSLRAYLAFYVE
ncbi:MAG: winged helix DNA-binding protein [Chloroflexota bacterium]